jgi:Dyp-type peroxidase family
VSDEPNLDFADIQGNILRGYGFARTQYVFIEVVEAAAGRALLDSLIDPVTTNQEWTSGKPDETVNVALTYAGLVAIDTPAAVLDAFPEAFREGMAGRAAILNDVGPSDPSTWDDGLGTGTAHILVTINGRSQEPLDVRRAWLDERIAASGGGLRIAHEQEAGLLAEAREHFGWADGFAQPSVEGSGLAPKPGEGVPERFGEWRPLKAGEFILGYNDEDGSPPAGPPDPYGQNGTFMVWRKLRQDVALFRDTLREAAKNYPGGEELLAAKVVGRWPDGTSLVMSPEGPDPEIAGNRDRLNDFRYDDDPDGLRCPIGAHVRRAYPRDALGWGGRMSTRHRMIRRGVPYGPPLPQGAPDDGVDRGMIFVCFVADLARQFEVVQAQWCNDGNAFGLGHDRDWLLGDNDGTGKMTINGSPPFFLSPQPSFVTARGGEYLFVPGLDALRALSTGAPAMAVS